MKSDELLTKIRGMAANVDAGGRDFLAVQINVTGEDGGVFYVEIKDGKVSIEPYEYNDRQCAITISLENLNKMLDGKLDSVAAFMKGQLKVDGDMGKAMEFSKFVKGK